MGVNGFSCSSIVVYKSYCKSIARVWVGLNGKNEHFNNLDFQTLEICSWFPDVVPYAVAWLLRSGGQWRRPCQSEGPRLEAVISRPLELVPMHFRRTSTSDERVTKGKNRNRTAASRKIQPPPLYGLLAAWHRIYENIHSSYIKYA